jgi:outer membrane protein OmpA-like peptidoglycan-associated protein
MILFAALLCAARAGFAQPQADIRAMVYFESDSSVLNGSARERLDDIIRHGLRFDARAWLLEGHDDTAALADASMAMSQRRAEAVRDYLIAHGVPAASIRVTSHGETQLERATYDGVVEPLNRRVVINVRFSPDQVANPGSSR